MPSSDVQPRATHRLICNTKMDVDAEREQLENHDNVLQLEQSNLVLRKMELEERLARVEILLLPHANEEHMGWLMKFEMVSEIVIELFTKEKKRLRSEIANIEDEISNKMIEIHENLEAISRLEKVIKPEE